MKTSNLSERSEGPEGPAASWTYFPLYAVTDGVCACPKGAACGDAGKHPRTSWGSLAAGAAIEGEPGEGRGIATGHRSGVFVLDVDNKPGGVNGFETLRALGPVPRTYTVTTPTGGAHYYFEIPPGRAIKTSGGALGPGLDVRGEGGYVVGPGSRHKNGGVYEVADSSPIAPAPAWLLARPELYPSEVKAEDGASNHVPISPEHPRWEELYARGVDACRTFEACTGNGKSAARLGSLFKRLLWDFELPQDVAVDLVLEHFNPRCTYPDGKPWPWSEKQAASYAWNVARSTKYKQGVAPEGWVERFKESLSKPHLDADNEAHKAIDEMFKNGGNERATDTGNANIFVRLHQGRVRYVDTWQKWMIWDGRRWEVSTDTVALDLTSDVSQARRAGIRIAPPNLGPDEEETERHRQAWATRSESNANRQCTLTLAKSDSRIRRSHREFDKKPFAFNVENGTIDLRTGELRPHAQDDLLTKVSPIHYDPNAACPTWEAFLAKVVPDVETREYLHRATGYSLTGDVSEQVLFFLQGGGSNGKSTFVNMLCEVLGEYGKTAAPDLLLSTKNEKHATELADLCGARLVIASETEKGRDWAEARLKLLTGGDRVKARRMREDFWEFEPTHKFWISSNHAPAVRGTDDGIWRRIKKIPFTVKIEDAEKDPKLVAKLRGELAGILRWAVEGCLKWQASGLGAAPQVESAVAEYRASQDIVAKFIAEACDVGHAPDGTEFRAPRADLWRAFKLWAEEANEEPGKKGDFFEEVEQRGHGKVKSSGTDCFKRIRLRGPHSAQR